VGGTARAADEPDEEGTGAEVGMVLVISVGRTKGCWSGMGWHGGQLPRKKGI
jgi:hypothetical protein